jgi:hypothetical protein
VLAFAVDVGGIAFQGLDAHVVIHFLLHVRSLSELLAWRNQFTGFTGAKVLALMVQKVQILTPACPRRGWAWCPCS